MIQSRVWRFSGLLRPVTHDVASLRSTSRILTRAASLSAIHRGLRQSEKIQYGSERRPGTGSWQGQARTEKALAGAASTRQQYRLKKKLARKAEEKEQKREEGNIRQTRRKRFLDPDLNFGKKSLVYQLKNGALKEKAANLDLQDFVRPVSFRSKIRERRASRDTVEPRQDQMSGRDHDRGRERRVMQGSSDDPRQRRSGEQDHDRGREKRVKRDTIDPRQRRSAEHEHGRGREGRVLRDPIEPRQRRTAGEEHNRGGERRVLRDNIEPRQRRSAEQEHRNDEAAAPRRKKMMMAMTIKYTTAASQFLYGKSVVKAALEQSRRQLYNLYIFGGETRRDAKEKDNAAMARLAKLRRVPVTIVPSGEQRLMDKMSMGRPHNGFVLETSPLPKLPITSLGKLEETAAQLGFHVELDFQTKEEVAVNGTNTFVPRASDNTPKPLVLLLHEIVDPGNLGALIRSASYLGVDAVAITNRNSSNLTPVVLKSATGAAEEIPIFTVDSPEKFIDTSRKMGWKTYAAVAPSSRKLVPRNDARHISVDDIEKFSPLNENPCILVMGNEGFGLSKQMKTAADCEISIPRFVWNSSVDSLNVSVAAGLLCHAFVKQPIHENEARRVSDDSEDLQEDDKDDAANADEGVEGEEKIF